MNSLFTAVYGLLEILPFFSLVGDFLHENDEATLAELGIYGWFSFYFIIFFRLSIHMEAD